MIKENWTTNVSHSTTKIVWDSLKCSMKIKVVTKKSESRDGIKREERDDDKRNKKIRIKYKENGEK